MSANPYTPPPWDDLLSLANKAITAPAPVAVLPNGNETANVTISLAAAARSRRLMMGLVTLVESDHDDVMGGMLRTLYETWLVGIYALLGGDEALQRLLAQRDKQQKMFAKVLGEPIDELSDGQTLGVEVLAGKVTTLLESDSHENAQFARAAYTFFYRFESYRSTHGGLGSIIGERADACGQVRIASRRSRSGCQTNPGPQPEQTRQVGAVSLQEGRTEGLLHSRTRECLFCESTESCHR